LSPGTRQSCLTIPLPRFLCHIQAEARIAAIRE
jgi:hypothetical protein